MDTNFLESFNTKKNGLKDTNDTKKEMNPDDSITPEYVFTNAAAILKKHQKLRTGSSRTPETSSRVLFDDYHSK